ncbi:uncharacterized protein LOC110932487 [Helianthus annuus]|uniref:uncharacterized protein LOC110932487 n=1 Tax=Helianthus annuus TaxID=4232 RepID=UPI000B904BCB|nr:uncharacterized protein LOC110932487 [Helianthus annuus]
MALLGQPGLTGDSDRWIWTLDGSGAFSVQCVKAALKRQQHVPSPYTIKHNNWVPKKVEILAWRAEMERLPTKCALERRNINVGSILCPICSEHNETAEHLLVSCGFAQAIWQAISLWLKIPPIFAFGLKDILELHNFVGVSLKSKKAVYAVCLSVMWCVWKARNELIFNQTGWSLEKVVGDIKALSFLWVKARSKHPGLDWKIWSGFNMYQLGW